MNKAAGEELVTVFIPSSPTPVTGYTILVPAKDVIRLSMTVEGAFRYAVSAGVLIPPEQLSARALERETKGLSGKVSQQTKAENRNQKAENKGKKDGDIE